MGQSELTALGRKVAELQDGAPEAHLDKVRGRARLLAAAPAPARRRSRSGYALAFAASFAVLAFAAFLVLRVRARPPLSFAFGAEPGAVGSWIAAPPATARDIRFSDGSLLHLLPGGRARVTAVDADGAEVALEEGTLEVSVVHREHTHWSVRGGPFQVRVVGTRFQIRWDPVSERFDVALREGAVTLSGPVVGEARAVRAGERLTVTKSTLEVSSIDAATAAAAATEEAAPPAPAPLPSTTEDARPAPSSVASTTAPHAPASAPRVEPSARSAASGAASGAHTAPPAAAELPAWRVRAREARYKDAIVAAEADGFDGICASASVGDLRVLADSARLAGSGARAVQAYKALRKRFPSTSDAAAAAFILGRMAQDQDKDYAHAAGWFVLYLSEAPDGEFAADAMGRLVEAADRTGDEAGAVRAAERYLGAYPNGPHADYAKRVLARHASP